MEDEKLKKQLQDYQTRVEGWLDLVRGTKFNKEENITVKFIVPLLEILGWNPFSEDMEFEYYIRNKNKKGGRFVDVVLYVDNKPKILVEVKPIQDKLEHASKQIFRYLVDSGIYYGIVTNGIELQVFSRKYCRKGYKKGRELFRLKIDRKENKNDFLAYLDVLLVISRDYIGTGLFDVLAKAFQTKEYWDWRKRQGNRYSENELSLEFAREYLRNKAQEGVHQSGSG